MKTLSAFLLLCFISNARAQSHNERIRLGDKPAIKITDWIANVPSDKNLNGKFIVLEFWTTHCQPCLKAVPHLNALQSKFANQDVYFLSLTDEDAKTVRKTLDKIKFNSIVVSDNRFTNSFWTGGIDKLTLPFTLLIDKNGEVRWIGMPNQLNEKVIKDFVAGTLAPYSMFQKKR